MTQRQGWIVECLRSLCNPKPQDRITTDKGRRMSPFAPLVKVPSGKPGPCYGSALTFVGPKYKPLISAIPTIYSAKPLETCFEACLDMLCSNFDASVSLDACFEVYLKACLRKQENLFVRLVKSPRVQRLALRSASNLASSGEVFTKGSL